MVNPDVDGYTKNPIKKKYSKKRKKASLLKTVIKECLNWNISYVGACFLHLAGHGRKNAPFPSRQLLYCNKHFKYWLNKNNQCFGSLLQLININASNLSSVKRNLSGLSIRPATLKIRLLVISKLLTISSNRRLRWSASQHSIVQFSIWNEQWCQYSCASVYWTESQWSTKLH